MVLNYTTFCVEHVYNPVIVDEKFNALIQYFKH
jgi:hypothetical protein